MNGQSMVWVNGMLMSADEVRVSPFDLGVTVGGGVFETLMAYEGRVFAWDRHYERMVEGASILGIDPSLLLSESAMREVMEELVRFHLLKGTLGWGRARVRVSLSGGVNPLSGGSEPGQVIVTAVPSPEPASLATLQVVDFPCRAGKEWSRVKSASFAENVMAWREGMRMGADEAIRLNYRGELCECAMANLFLIKEGRVETPSLESGCLAGVTRQIVGEICGELGLVFVETTLTEDDLRRADGLFITSAVREVQPAVLLDALDASDALDTRKEAGEIVAQISGVYQKWVQASLPS
jgi:branched-chain amino acid aminotransferase